MTGIHHAYNPVMRHAVQQAALRKALELSKSCDALVNVFDDLLPAHLFAALLDMQETAREVVEALRKMESTGD